MNINMDYEGKEKRLYPRINYLTTKKPKLKIGKRKFEVLDISPRGIRFLKNERGILQEFISGKLTLVCGESFPVEGSLIWEQDDVFAIYLKNIIPPKMIQKEKTYIQKNAFKG